MQGYCFASPAMTTHIGFCVIIANEVKQPDLEHKNYCIKLRKNPKLHSYFNV